MLKDFNPRRLDVRALAEGGAHLQGAQPLRDHARLLAETGGRGGDHVLRWSAYGESRNPTHVQPQVWLRLEVATSMSLVCQRCLQPVELPVALDRLFRFVDDESTAAAQDDEAEEDVLVLSREFNLMELLEDEVIMAVPVAPMHEHCPQPLPVPTDHGAADEPVEQRKNPFAALHVLRQSKPG